MGSMVLVLVSLDVLTAYWLWEDWSVEKGWEIETGGKLEFLLVLKLNGAFRGWTEISFKNAGYFL